MDARPHTKSNAPPGRVQALELALDLVQLQRGQPGVEAFWPSNEDSAFAG